MSPEDLLPSGSILQQALAKPDHDPVQPAGGETVVGGVTIRVLDRGVILFEPQSSTDAATKSLVISAGVHGNETGPIELVDALVNDILAGKQAVASRLLVIIGNPEAMISQTRFVEENLNRLFSGAHEESTSMEAGRAADIEAHVRTFYQGDNGGSNGGSGGAENGGESASRVHYDLHTAIRSSAHERFVILPFGDELTEEQLDFLAVSGIHAILLAHAPSTTFSYFTSNSFGAHAFTVELGKVQPFGQNDPARLAAIDTGLRAVIGGEVLEVPTLDDPILVFEVIDEVLRHSEEGFELHLDDDVPNFTVLLPGYQLTSDRNSDPNGEAGSGSGSTEGPEAGFIVSEHGSAIVFPNKAVPVGQRVALIVQHKHSIQRKPTV